MAEWIYFVEPPREHFAATMTPDEQVTWSEHFARLERLYQDGAIVLVGPTLGDHNTGICIFEAPDEASARAIMDADPTIARGFAAGELRPFRVSLLRGRDDARVAADLAALASPDPAPAALATAAAAEDAER